MNDLWETPDYIFEPLNEIFNFDCDVASNDKNAKCEKHFTLENSAFENLKDWGKMNWCNPPYSRGGTEPFIDAAIYNLNLGNRTVILLKCDPSTKAFQKTWTHCHHYFYYKRIKFKGAKSGANFPSCLCIFGNLTLWEVQMLIELNQGFLKVIKYEHK